LATRGARWWQNTVVSGEELLLVGFSDRSAKMSMSEPGVSVPRATEPKVRVAAADSCNGSEGFVAMPAQCLGGPDR
jgi:hypothetical protein